MYTFFKIKLKATEAYKF